MPAYAYTAINAAGIETAGEVTARDFSGAEESLRARGLLALQLVEHTDGSEGRFSGMVKRVKPKALQIFSRQFATMIESGLNVVTALSILEEQTEDKNLADVLASLRADVEGGQLLSEAMARHPRVFSRLYVAMVEAGEAAGILDIVLDRVALQLEKEMQLKRRVKGAMVYPILVMCFAFLVLTGMLLFLVPIFVKLFDQLGGELPFLTKIVMHASEIMRDYSYIVFPLFFLIIFMFFRWKRTEQGRRWWDVPGPIPLASAVCSRSAWRVSAGRCEPRGRRGRHHPGARDHRLHLGNSLIEEATADVRERVQQGSTIAQPISRRRSSPRWSGT